MNSVKLINLTPHPINLVTHTGSTLEIAPSGQVARLGEHYSDVSRVDVDGARIRLVRKGLNDVQGLPDPQEGVLYIVSAIVCNAEPYRDDLVYACDFVRNDKGQIVAARALSLRD